MTLSLLIPVAPDVTAPQLSLRAASCSLLFNFLSSLPALALILFMWTTRQPK